MNIDIKNIVTLEDECEYIVISKLKSNNKEYFYLVDINDNKKFKFCYLENDYMVEVTNKNILVQLITLFSKKIKEDIIS